METLATLFVGIVTIANTVVPGIKVDKILSTNPLNSSKAVLSETDDLSESVNSKTSTDARSLKIRQLIEKQKSERLQNIEALKQKREATATTRETKREQFKEKLSEVSDERKQKIVLQIDDNLSSLNTKWVTKWNEVLTRLSAILVKIETRTETLKTDGKDTSEIENAITNAKSAIGAAQLAVNTQSEKTYTITLSDESNLGQDVKTTINLFHNDIKNTKDAVEDARKSVMSILRLIKGGSKAEVED